MTIAKKIKQYVAELPDDYLLVASDVECDVSERGAVSRALQRMAQRGELSRLSSGKFYKPRVTVFGALKPSPARLVKDFLVKDGEVVGYLTGMAALAQYSLTTQISSKIEIGTNEYRGPMQRDGFDISFILQRNRITEDNIELLKILDCLKFIGKIPATSSDEACKRLIFVVREVAEADKARMVEYALNYSPYVRALYGAILELLGYGGKFTDRLKQSLSGVSKYKLDISEATLPTKKNWRIYAPTRR